MPLTAVNLQRAPLGTTGRGPRPPARHVPLQSIDSTHCHTSNKQESLAVLSSNKSQREPRRRRNNCAGCFHYRRDQSACALVSMRLGEKPRKGQRVMTPTTWPMNRIASKRDGGPTLIRMPNKSTTHHVCRRGTLWGSIHLGCRPPRGRRREQE